MLGLIGDYFGFGRGREREEALASRLARMAVERAALRDALEAVLLYHSGEPWTGRSTHKWRQLTGEDEATSKSLCDAVRRALGES